jgi:hypothetical protein
MLVGMSLALTVLVAVLSTYTLLAQHMVRLANQQTLETEARRTLLAFEQDVRATTGLTSASSTGLTLTLPTATGSTDVSYAYYSSTTTVAGVSIPAESLVRRSPAASGIPRVLLRNILSSEFGSSPYTYGFTYYDASGQQYAHPVASSDLGGIKQLSLAFRTATGSTLTGTRTPTYIGATPRLILRNKPFLP